MPESNFKNAIPPTPPTSPALKSILLTSIFLPASLNACSLLASFLPKLPIASVYTSACSIPPAFKNEVTGPPFAKYLVFPLLSAVRAPILFWAAFLLTTNSPGVNIAGTVSVPFGLKID